MFHPLTGSWHRSNVRVPIFWLLANRQLQLTKDPPHGIRQPRPGTNASLLDNPTALALSGDKLYVADARTWDGMNGCRHLCVPRSSLVLSGSLAGDSRPPFSFSRNNRLMTWLVRPELLSTVATVRCSEGV